MVNSEGVELVDAMAEEDSDIIHFLPHFQGPPYRN